MRTSALILSVMTVVACGDDGNKTTPDARPTGDAATTVDGAATTDAAASVTCAADNGGITLPAGFCATIFADHVGAARQIAVTPMGRVFVAVPPSSDTANDGHVVALYDADNDGVAEQSSMFGSVGGNGIAWQDGQLYVAANDRIVRYALPDGMAAPTSATPATLVGGLPTDGDHNAKTVVLIGTTMYINIGSPSNSCQVANRQLHSPGVDPCPELATRAGVWQYSLATTNLGPIGTRIGTGMRNTNALAIDPATMMLWGAINGRDQLHENWPEHFTAAQDSVLPSDELVAVKTGTDRGWPYCYHDAIAMQMKLAPEYGGDGVMQGRCASITQPEVAIAAHSAPLSIAFARGTQFPEAYRNGVFIANHGTHFDVNATPADLHGYDVEFVPFAAGVPSGALQKFATGFDAGMRPVPDNAPHRPVGLATMPDGSLLIGDDKGGRIWRVYYKGT
jgi:glucose/arabinose dehydrogenase